MSDQCKGNLRSGSSNNLSIGGFYAFILGRNKNVELSVVARSNYEVVKKDVCFSITPPLSTTQDNSVAEHIAGS
jgi:hypothetical protein